MTTRLPRLTLGLILALLSAQPTFGQLTDGATLAAGSAELPSGDELLVHVLSEIERRGSIAASVLQHASFGGRQLQGGGTYLQQWGPHREKLHVRLQLQGQVSETPVSLLQVSNGDLLWTDYHTPVGRRVTRVDLRQIRRETDLASKELHRIGPGLAGWIPIEIEYSGEQGGLPMLIVALAQNFSFSPPVELRLSNEPVWGVIGNWRPENLAELWPPSDLQTDSAATADSSQRLPSHLPHSVMLLVGRDDYFPYVVEYRRNGATPTNRPHEPSDFQLRPNALLLLQFYEVDFDVAVRPGEFDFSPGDAEPIDMTARRLEQLKRSKDARLAAWRENAPRR